MLSDPEELYRMLAEKYMAGVSKWTTSTLGLDTEEQPRAYDRA